MARFLTLVARPLLLLAALISMPFGAPASAERIKDMGQFQGLRANQLTGYGIVVGLAGTGDDSLDYATLAMKGAVSRFGLTLPPGVNPSLKNAAAVMITAELPPFAKPGQRLDITVSALGKAKSLRGGTLVMAPLYGADGQIYAMAQGNLVVGGLGIDAADGSKVAVNVPSSGRVDGGATVERAVDTGFTNGDQLVFNLHDQDLTNAKLVAEAINRNFGAGTAQASDGGSISIVAPQGGPARIGMMSMIENIEIKPSEPPARVIVNSRTGTVVIGSHVRVLPAAVAHGSLLVTIRERSDTSQPNAFAQGTTVTTPRTEINVDQPAARMFVFDAGVDLNDIVRAVNQVGAAPGDLVAILEALRQAGSLRAELVVI